MPQGPVVDTPVHYVGGAHCSAAANVPRALVLRAAALALQHFHERRDLSHDEDRRFFDGHAVAFGTVVLHVLRAHRFSQAISHIA